MAKFNKNLFKVSACAKLCTSAKLPQKKPAKNTMKLIISIKEMEIEKQTKATVTTTTTKVKTYS